MTTDEEVISNIETLLSELRPNIQMDGGDIELISYRHGSVTLRISGFCVQCPSFREQVCSCVEERLKESIPEIAEINFTK